MEVTYVAVMLDSKEMLVNSAMTSMNVQPGVIFVLKILYAAILTEVMNAGVLMGTMVTVSYVQISMSVLIQLTILVI